MHAVLAAVGRCFSAGGARDLRCHRAGSKSAFRSKSYGRGERLVRIEPLAVWSRQRNQPRGRSDRGPPGRMRQLLPGNLQSPPIFAMLHCVGWAPKCPGSHGVCRGDPKSAYSSLKSRRPRCPSPHPKKSVGDSNLCHLPSRATRDYSDVPILSLTCSRPPFARRLPPQAKNFHCSLPSRTATFGPGYGTISKAPSRASTNPIRPTRLTALLASTRCERMMAEASSKCRLWELGERALRSIAGG